MSPVAIPAHLAQRHQRLFSALAETNRFIARESARADDLRPADVQRLLDWYRRHAAWLQDQLDEIEALVR